MAMARRLASTPIAVRQRSGTQSVGVGSSSESDCALDAEKITSAYHAALSSGKAARLANCVSGMRSSAYVNVLPRITVNVSTRGVSLSTPRGSCLLKLVCDHLQTAGRGGRRLTKSKTILDDIIDIDLTEGSLESVRPCSLLSSLTSDNAEGASSRSYSPAALGVTNRQSHRCLFRDEGDYEKSDGSFGFQPLLPASVDGDADCAELAERTDSSATDDSGIYDMNACSSCTPAFFGTPLRETRLHPVAERESERELFQILLVLSDYRAVVMLNGQLMVLTIQKLVVDGVPVDMHGAQADSSPIGSHEDHHDDEHVTFGHFSSHLTSSQVSAGSDCDSVTGTVLSPTPSAYRHTADNAWPSVFDASSSSSLDSSVEGSRNARTVQGGDDVDRGDITRQWTPSKTLGLCPGAVAFDPETETIYTIAGHNRHGALSGVDSLRIRENTWLESVATLKRSWCQGASAQLNDGSVYLLGGMSNARRKTLSITSSVLRSPPLSCGLRGSWTAAPSLSSGRRHNCATAIANGQAILSVGGRNMGGELDRMAELYHIGDTQWRPVAPTSQPRSCSCCAAMDDQAYVLGGESCWLHDPVASVERYDGERDAWLASSPMANARRSAAACQVDRQLYVSGGVNTSLTISAVEALDPRQGQWQALPPMNRPRSSHAMLCIPSRFSVCVLGGHGTQAFLNTVEWLDVRYPAWQPGLTA